MPEYLWNPAKDEWLRRNRGLSFYHVVHYLQHGGFLADIPHPNQVRHPEERLYIINIEGYAYEVPFYRIGDIETLMTAYPSRKYTREHLR